MKKKLSKILGIGLSIALATSLLVAAIPAIALSAPSVTFDFGQNVISTENADYVIRFNVGKQLTENMSIVITLPEGTTVTTAANLTGASIAAGPGWITPGPVWQDANVTANAAANWTADATFRTITKTLVTGEYIGESAEVRISITGGIKNPATPGDYTLTVGTKKADGTTLEAAVTSATYAITTPSIDPLSGIVTAYNSAGIMMWQDHDINTCIKKAGAGGTIEIGPGTYAQDVVANVAGQTLKGTGEAGTVIIGRGGKLLIGAGPASPTGTTGVTVDGLTISYYAFAPEVDMVTVNGSGQYAVIKNCSITTGTNSAVNAANVTSISNTTIDTTLTGAQTGIMATAEKLTVTDCTIKVGVSDTAIKSSGGTTLGASSVSGTTITGSSGDGVWVTNGVITIDKSTFTSLNTAIDTDNGTVTVKNSVIDGCGGSTVGTGDAIEVALGTVIMYNNTIQNSAAANWAMNIASGTVKAHFNNILNNTKNITTAVAANATHNWWGAASGPAAGSTGGGTFLALTPYLGNSVTAASVAVNAASLAAKDAVGMDVAILTGTAQVIGVAKYSANPELTPPAVMGVGKVVGYYDLYVAGAPANQIVQAKFYVPVTNYTKLYYAGGISGQWSKVENAGVNLAAGFVYADIGGVTGGLSVSDLGGTVFAVVEDKTTTAGPSIVSGVGAPLIGSYDISIEPMFTWGAVPGSIRYEIALSEDPTFTIIEWSYNVDQTFYKVDEALRYDTTYYWRVRGVLGEPYQEAGQWKTPATPWTVGIFTTASEPLPPPDPIIVNPVKPEVNVEIPATKITIEPSSPAIPTYMLWVIVAVGAILIIALIVLIVRTRRVV